jgi:hypothetical protein
MSIRPTVRKSIIADLIDVRSLERFSLGTRLVDEFEHPFGDHQFGSDVQRLAFVLGERSP